MEFDFSLKLNNVGILQYDDDADYDDDEDSIGREDDGNEDVLDEQVGSCCPWPWAQLGAAHLLSHCHFQRHHFYNYDNINKMFVKHFGLSSFNQSHHMLQGLLVWNFHKQTDLQCHYDALMACETAQWAVDRLSNE